MRRIIDFKLDENQVYIIQIMADKILNSPIYIQNAAYREIIGGEPTNLELKAFLELVRKVQAEQAEV